MPDIMSSGFVLGHERDSRLLRHDFAIFPHVDRRAMHPGGFASDFGGSPECTPDGLGKLFAPHQAFLPHRFLSSKHGESPELS